MGKQTQPRQKFYASYLKCQRYFSGEKRLDAILITGGRLWQSGYPDVAESEILLADNCTIPNLPKPVRGHALVSASDASGKKQVRICSFL